MKRCVERDRSLLRPAWALLLLNFAAPKWRALLLAGTALMGLAAGSVTARANVAAGPADTAGSSYRRGARAGKPMAPSSAVAVEPSGRPWPPPGKVFMRPSGSTDQAMIRVAGSDASDALGAAAEPESPSLPDNLLPGKGGAVPQIHLDPGEQDLPEAARTRLLEVDLAWLIQTALERNLDLTLARLDVERARTARRAALGALLPSGELLLGAGHTDGRVQGSFGELREVEFSTINPSLALTYRSNIGADVARLAARGARLAASRHDALSHRQQVLLAVGGLHQELLAAWARFRIASHLVEAAAEALRIVSARVHAGLGLGADEARARAALAAARHTLIQARRQWETTSAGLSRVLDRDPRELLRPGEDALRRRPLVNGEAGVDELIKLGLAQRPDLAASRKRTAAAQHQESAARWDLLGPDVEGEIRQTDIGTSSGNLEPRTNYRLQLGWSLDLQEMAQRGRRHVETLASQARTEQVAMEVSTAVTEAWRASLAATERIHEAEVEVLAAGENLTINQTRLSRGSALLLEVIDSQEEQGRARVRLAAALMDYNIAQVHLLGALGLISKTALLEPDAQ